MRQKARKFIITTLAVAGIAGSVFLCTRLLCSKSDRIEHLKAGMDSSYQAIGKPLSAARLDSLVLLAQDYNIEPRLMAIAAGIKDSVSSLPCFAKKPPTEEMVLEALWLNTSHSSPKVSKEKLARDFKNKLNSLSDANEIERVKRVQAILEAFKGFPKGQQQALYDALWNKGY